MSSSQHHDAVRRVSPSVMPMTHNCTLRCHEHVRRQVTELPVNCGGRYPNGELSELREKNSTKCGGCHECCSTSRHQHQDVWWWSLTRPTPWASLAWRRWPHQIPTLCQRLSTRHGTTILVWALHTGRRDAWTSSSFCCRGQLHTPRFRLTNYGWRSFCCAAPSTWNCLPDALKDTDLSLASFQKQLKTFLSSRY